MVTVLLDGSDGYVDPNHRNLPLRLKAPSPAPAPEANPFPKLAIHPFPSQGGVLLKVENPPKPTDPGVDHVPCDIVLVLDVSGSMAVDAPAPVRAGEEQERNGLSVLDLVKHAANTIVSTMNENDRLGIVTFSSEANVLQELTSMSPAGKNKARKSIASMRPEVATNLWHGLQEGLKLFLKASRSPSGKVPALMILTDGMPNHMCPPQGYINKLRSMEEIPATIHTFGFGYSLRSGLLKSIAEIGGGNYSFIPDAGMIGTTFVHAVANLQSTFVSNAVLRLTYPSYLKLEETTGESVDKKEPVQLEDNGPASLTQLTLSLGNLQYGQSRDVFLRFNSSATWNPDPSHPPIINAVLEYQHFTPVTFKAVAHASVINDSTTLPCAELAYHMSRSAVIAFLSTFYPLRADGEHQPLASLPTDTKVRLQKLTTTLPANQPDFTSDPACQSLLDDLRGAEPRGQITLALTKRDHWLRWGMHYLPSLAGAYSRQLCNSFKDAGPLLYGAQSELFVRCRDRLYDAFDSLPPPPPSNFTTSTQPLDMTRYSSNAIDDPCFAGCAKVLLAPADGGAASAAVDVKMGRGVEEGRMIRIGRLRAGMRVMTPKGPRKVIAVLKTPVARAELCLVGGGLLVTPWHPVSLDGRTWMFPTHVARRAARYTGSIFSILLQRDADVDAHAILVGGMWGVTLGHGVVASRAAGLDVRAHEFLGDYDRVMRSLAKLHRSRSGLVLGGGVRRDVRTGLVDGFKLASPAQVVKAVAAAKKKPVIV
ncbi:hint-domain-containing protein [Podospora appendiculata]|uniref:Hint-domain-containing protein n=1 Tax=Podospora appendiculata TaxID=314037 RepID=A0AAE0X162_9PEZI|nr:hint-domain-containing protein [Podospora appendiculata]